MQLCIKPKCMSQDAKEADTKRNRARQQTLITFNVMLILAKPASNAIQQYMGYTIKKRDATPDTPENEYKEDYLKRVEYARTKFK